MMRKKTQDTNERKMKMLKAPDRRGFRTGQVRRESFGNSVRNGVRAPLRGRNHSGPGRPESRWIIGELGHASGMTEKGGFPGNFRKSSKSSAGRRKNGWNGKAGLVFIPGMMFDAPIRPKRKPKPSQADIEAEYRLERVYHQFFRRPVKPK